jgi:single-strand DNA-binding protein
MPSLNKVFLMGNLTKDPELKYIPSGSAVTSFGMAINRKFKAKDGSMKDDVCFVNITVWGKTAENCNEYLSKGSPVFVEGRLQYRSYEKDGQKRNVLDVVADRVQFLSGKKKTGGEGTDEVPEEVAEAPAADSDKAPF